MVPAPSLSPIFKTQIKAPNLALMPIVGKILKK